MGQQNGRQTGAREWAVYGEILPERVFPGTDEPLPLPVDKGEVEQMAADVANVVTMIGGTALMGAERIKDPYTGMFITTAVYWKWHSYAPRSDSDTPARGKRGGQQQRAEAEFQQPGPEPQEPESGEDEAGYEDRPADEFMPLSPDEERAIERAELVEEPA